MFQTQEQLLQENSRLTKLIKEGRVLSLLACLLSPLLLKHELLDDAIRGKRGVMLAAIAEEVVKSEVRTLRFVVLSFVNVLVLYTSTAA